MGRCVCVVGGEMQSVIAIIIIELMYLQRGGGVERARQAAVWLKVCLCVYVHQCLSVCK